MKRRRLAEGAREEPRYILRRQHLRPTFISGEARLFVFHQIQGGERGTLHYEEMVLYLFVAMYAAEVLAVAAAAAMSGVGVGVIVVAGQ